jgi:hypothetical protein
MVEMPLTEDELAVMEYGATVERGRMPLPRLLRESYDRIMSADARQEAYAMEVRWLTDLARRYFVEHVPKLDG